LALEELMILSEIIRYHNHKLQCK